MAFEFYCLEEEAYYSLEFPNPSDEEIDGAATEVFLETYIFADDEIGHGHIHGPGSHHHH